MTGRVPGSARTPGSGRRKGSIDKAKRELLSAKMAGEIWATFKRLGPDWLFQLAKDRPDLFVGHFLVRLLPPALKDTEGDGPLVNLNFHGDDVELARRVAFSLAKAAHVMGQDAEVVADRVPYVHLASDPSPQELLRVDQPDPAREAWAETVALSQEERLNRESLEEHCNRRAFAAPRPAWMDSPKPSGRPFVGHPRRDDLL